jgi:meckelin
VSRGLDAASPGEQVFTFFFSSAFRNQINKIYSFIKQREGEDTVSHIGIAELSTFLRGFIDQQPPPAIDGLKYMVKQPLISETLLGVTPADFRQSDPKCIMQTDCTTNWSRDYHFLSQTFIGIETDLLLHDILTFNVADLLFSNTALSAFIAYSMHLARTHLALYFARKNLASTSQIDERFLLW